ncbi:lysosomal alpha-glucosidase-like isoform X1 [Branchiostoma floridae x Branchiostoma belcheri]
MVLLRLTILTTLLASALGYTAQTCPSNIPESQRRDCHPEHGSTEASCAAKGCMWCEASYQGPPWCFYDESFAANTPAPGSCDNSLCPSCIPEYQRQDCHPEHGSTEGSCAAKGCVWCPASTPGTPWCFFDSNVVVPGGGNNNGGGGQHTHGVYTCSAVNSVIPESQRVDCHPEHGSNQHSCEQKGCFWCPASYDGPPWCFYNQTGGPDTGGLAGNNGVCPTDITEENRIDCYPGGGATQGNCEALGCIWCESSVPNTPWCFYNGTFDDVGGEETYRVDCSPEGLNPIKCADRGCVMGAASLPGVPRCYFPPDRGYQAVGAPQDLPNGLLFSLKRVGGNAMFGGEVDPLAFLVEYQSDSRIHFKFYDPNDNRFEVPLDIGTPAKPLNKALYNFTWTNDPTFTFNITRTDTGATLFDTSMGGLVMEDQFLQIATKLPSQKVYGFGEHEHKSYQHDMNYQTWGMYSRDQPPAYKGNLYGVHPFYMNVEDDDNAHGVLILNSAAQDVTLTPAPALIYRTIGGVLDLYMFLGPTPENVVQQYTEAIGRPFMPPYWSLGFQLSRYGYNSLATVSDTIDRIRAYDIPHDVQFGDIDYMDEQMDFTYDPVTYAGYPDYIRRLRNDHGMHFVTILDPCITTERSNYRPYDLGQQMGIWINESDGRTPALGKVWPPGASVFPDYTSPYCHDYWITLCKEFFSVLPYDGLWIDMNEPANFGTGSIVGCDQNNINQPPFLPKIWGDLADKTLCPDFKTYIGNMYDTHSLFGWAQSPPTFQAVQEASGKRAFVVSRSTFPGSGKYSAHWLGDNYSQWSNLKNSIVGMLEFSLFGIPYSGADICGFNGDANYEQCNRWMQLGAFYPFARNHNGLGYREQDPGAWDAEFARISREVLLVRYTLNPYLYLLFHQAHTEGSTVVRPLLHEFVNDKETHAIDRQFLWGPALLFSPVLDEGMTSVDAYFPKARWYDYYTGAEISPSQQMTYVTLNAPSDYIPIHVRGGYVIPTQEPARTTTVSRTLPMGLIVALGDAQSPIARGMLFWDDGDSIDTYANGNYYLMEFVADNNGLQTLVHSDGYRGIDSLTFGTIRVFGLSSVSSIMINGFPHSSFTFDPTTKELQITSINVGVKDLQSIAWA